MRVTDSLRTQDNCTQSSLGKNNRLPRDPSPLKLVLRRALHSKHRVKRLIKVDLSPLLTKHHSMLVHTRIWAIHQSDMTLTRNLRF